MEVFMVRLGNALEYSDYSFVLIMVAAEDAEDAKKAAMALGPPFSEHPIHEGTTDISYVETALTETTVLNSWFA